MAFDLDRFVTAQSAVFASVLTELEAGRKRTPWMWFIFPQLRGLGSSPTAAFYAIGALDEAQAYLEHPILGNRLVRCTEAVLSVQGRSLHAIFGSPDDMKFHSSMTLFAQVAHPSAGLFRGALDRYCDGIMDERTLALLGTRPSDRERRH